jgi:hypothetical protein
MSALIIFSALLSGASSAPAAAPPYDSCPSAMRLEGGNCVYHAGNLLAPGFQCAQLAGKFGKFNCAPAAGVPCDTWAVDACFRNQRICANLSKGLKRGQALPQECTDAEFRIVDPQAGTVPSSASPGTPAPGHSGGPSADRGFREDLSSRYHVSQQLEALSAFFQSQVEGPRCIVPGGTVSLPLAYRRCLERADPSLAFWRTGAADEVTGVPMSRVRKVGDHFEIAANVRFRYQGAPENRDLVVAKTLAAIGCVERFFARHRIRLNLGLAMDDEQWSSWWGADIKDVTLRDTYSRSDALNWGILNNLGRPQTDDSRCFTITHEILHRLGLPDRYVEALRKPENYTSDGQSVMKTLESTENLTLIDEDLRILTEPVCGYSWNPEQLAADPVPQPAPEPRRGP